jgi:hypothetical protein
MLVAEGLWATSDGTSWREIPLRPSQDNWIPWVATGELGWIVYSPPREATVEADGSSAFQGPRHGNLGAWYTPDTEAWFEVTDLGPLANVVYNLGKEVGVLDTAMIVRDTDILVYAHIGKRDPYGITSNPHTEIWRLDVDVPPESAEVAFDFSTQSLCEWFSADEITQIVTSTYKEWGVLPLPGQLAQSQGVLGQANVYCEWGAGSGSFVALATDLERPPVGPFEPHVALDDSVRVSIQSDGTFILADGLDAVLVVDGHDEQLWFGHTTPDSLDGDVEMINTVGLTIANEMLKRMGWIETE